MKFSVCQMSRSSETKFVVIHFDIATEFTDHFLILHTDNLQGCIKWMKKNIKKEFIDKRHLKLTKQLL